MFAQTDSDTLKSNNLEQVVVTATRNERQLSSLPMPVTLVNQKQIQQMGAMRLDNVLAEQTGLFIVNDHGKGIQLQGFNPDYTLILVDGEPLIGRTAGTLELDRVAVGNIKQIEIVKGPSSSLYGSEALAGVINIITEQPNKTGATLNARYGANNTADFSVLGNYKKNKIGFSLFADRFASGGYDLTPETFGATVSPYVNYTLQPRINVDISNKTKLKASARWYKEEQNSAFNATLGGVSEKLNGVGTVEDQNYTLSLKHDFAKNLGVTIRTYMSTYGTNSTINYDKNGALYDKTYFDQTFVRPELIANYNKGEKHYFLLGVGAIEESVEATRYDEKKRFSSKYLFGQYEFFATEKLQFNLGGRYDAHSAYQNQFSPKFAALYKITEGLKLRASYGVGYKAPDFRQLYLNFTNAVAGYSVFGSNELLTNFNKLKGSGQINTVFVDPTTFGQLRAESSKALNFGLSYQTNRNLSASINFFRNDVKDLIESFPVAQKSNGQNLFSYQNIAAVYTQGMEINVGKDFQIGTNNNIQIAAGYQYLEAKDKSVLAKIDDKKVFRRNPETLVTENVSRGDYGGLLNRSKHAANFKVFYHHNSGFELNVRAIYRGRFGFSDKNSNAIVDTDEEYAKGNLLLNTTVGYAFNKFYFQAGLDNLGNFTDAMTQPGQAGRQWWVRTQYRF
ncbi:MAG: TonB-dependent receptor [Saprospiraceae bacterium]|nr:TonB-dependent receptor [Saprospiraceae bacterium]